MNWITWVLFMGLWISFGTSRWHNRKAHIINECLNEKRTNIVVPDNFNGVINATNYSNQTGCIIFVQKNRRLRRWWPNPWPQMNTSQYLLLSTWHTERDLHLHVLLKRQCNNIWSNLTDSMCGTKMGECQVICLDTKTVCTQAAFDENRCNSIGLKVDNKYIISTEGAGKNCCNCNNPVKKPEETLDVSHYYPELSSTNNSKGEEFSATKAADLVKKMSNLIDNINASTAKVTVGEGATGVLKINTEPNDTEAAFAYSSPEEDINIVDSRSNLDTFPRSILVPKEAFEKSRSLDASASFAAVFRFTNLSRDEMNSTVLGDEVLAIEMGATIMNLTDKLSINIRNMKYSGVPSCQSWNGEGSRPIWTSDGCQTIQNGADIECLCSHLTFFAVLLTPLNETTSSSELKNLTIITKVGCGSSMFFLSIILFMHFLLRKTKANKAPRIFIQLVLAMFLLNLTFLINNFVAKMKSSVGCKIMAALMHYFLLATFTWFAAQAFHLFLQLHAKGKVVIRHYVLKVSIISWVLPSVFWIALLAMGKYGEEVINTTDESVTMCWITDSNVHIIVNIGYYALIFLFTFIVFIVMLSWFFHLKGTNAQNGSNGKRIATIMGLCCMLGITWGFAFFAYGILRIPSYYIFTILNSFQGFFLFIYYYNTSQETNGGERDDSSANSANSTSSTATLKTSFNNPYVNMPSKR